MSERAITSSDGRYTVVDNQSFGYRSEYDDVPVGTQSVHLIDNATGIKTELYSYSGDGAGKSGVLSFSADGLCVLFEAIDGLDYAYYHSTSVATVYNTLTKEQIKVTPDHSTTAKLELSPDRSSFYWMARGEFPGKDRDTFYYPTIPQFALPTISGDKNNSTWSGKLVVGDAAYISLELKGITSATDQQNITLSLSTGGTAVYDEGASTPGKVYVFKYVVKPDEVTKDLSIVSVNLNGAVLKGNNGKDAFISQIIQNIAGVTPVNGYIGSTGSDNFSGTLGAETFSGGSGDDIYRINNAGDRVFEGAGNGTDTVVTTISYTLTAKQEIEIFRIAKSEGSAHLNLTGNEFAQTLEGGGGNNILDGRGGADYMRGYRGNDTYIVDNALDFVREIAGQGYDIVQTTASYALGTGQEIEVLRAATPKGMAALRLTGNEFANALFGNAGSNVLNGGGGADTLTGAEGNDSYIVDGLRDRVIEAKGEGIDAVFASTSYALAAGQEIESLQLLSSTGSARLNLTGNEFAQTLRGNGGANVLDGKGGADALFGGGGSDTYAVDNVGDRVFEAKGGGSDTVVATVSWALAAGQEVETIQLATTTGTKALNLTGNEFGQTLRGNTGNNVLDGRGGIDTMVGLAGNDTYGVDNARDVVIEARSGGTDTVASSISYALAAGQEIEVLRFAASVGERSLDLTGNEFGQSLTGSAGDNVLDGRLGSDVLTGGRGQDAFLFSTALGTGNVDRITDFAPVDDTIRLSEDIFAALDAGPLAARAFKNISAGRADTDDRILYKQATGELFYDADGSGKGAAVKFAVLDNHAKLTHDDFFVV